MDWQTVLSFKGKDGFGAAHFGLGSLHPIWPCTVSTSYRQWSWGRGADLRICYWTSPDSAPSLAPSVSKTLTIRTSLSHVLLGLHLPLCKCQEATKIARKVGAAE